MSTPMPHPTTLQSRLASQIVSHARVSGWQPGHHLTEDSLLPILGTSRTPVRAAMVLLEGSGVLERRPNRGFFLKSLPQTGPGLTASETDADPERVYLSIAMDRLARVLPDSVSENELMRRYDISRAQLRLVLARIATDGWIERRPGRGWSFLPLIDTLEAYRENYRFRQLLEPAAMRSPEFVVDLAKLDQLEAQQLAIRDGGHLAMSQIEMYALNSRFHEVLAEMSHNRFVVQSLVRLNQMRRLFEYGRPLNRGWSGIVTGEHLAIIRLLRNGRVSEAADLLEEHLSTAVTEKISRSKFALGQS